MGILGKNSRRTFLGVSMTVTAGFLLLKKLWPFQKQKQKTAMFLTHDGKLVEVDISKIPVKRKLVEKEELAKWVWRNQEV
jgi:hypothetical protein